MRNGSDARYHFTREAQELRRAWRANCDRSRRLHLELANHHRASGIACLLRREEHPA